MPKFTKKFDAIYEKHAPGVPVMYLRALAGHESSSNPKAQVSWKVGLLQITQGPLTDYNKAKGKNFKLGDLTDPVLNVKVYWNYYKMVIRVFDRLIAGQTAKAAEMFYRNFQVDWGNKEFVLLVTAAWNSGIGAVNRAAKMKRRPLEPVTVKQKTLNSIAAIARRDGTTKLKKLFSVAKQAWQVRVVATYFTFLKGKAKGFDLPKPKRGIGDLDGKTILLLLGLWLLLKRRR